MAMSSCKKHGDFKAGTSTLMGKKLAVICPKCAHEDLMLHRKTDVSKQYSAIQKTVMGLPSRYKSSRLKDIAASGEVDLSICKRLARYILEFDNRRESWPSFMIFSMGEQNGHIAGAMLNALTNRGYPVAYISAQDFILNVRATYGRGSDMTEVALINRYSQPECLVIDGIENIRNTVDDRLLLSTLIEKRFKDEKPTIILTRGDLFTVTERLNENVAACVADDKQMLMYDRQRVMTH